jgi:hypothetical protein
VPIPRPRKGYRWLAAQPSIYDLLITASTAVIGFSSVANYVEQRRFTLALLVAAATVAIFILAAVKHVIGLAEARKKESIHELEGCLHTLHAVLDPTSFDPSLVLRLAIHVPVNDALEQVTEYIGVPPRKGRRGRQFPANSGIIGKAYRENTVLVARRANDDYQLYLQELVREWNYTEDQARLLNPGAMEWMAVPIFDPDSATVQAVLFLEASKRDFFNEMRQELVLLAVSGVAIFIGKRYP